jgi:hypothetical protein
MAPMRTRIDETGVTVRFASRRDAHAIERLAELDSRSVPSGATLVAEVDGEILAALPLRGGTAPADPFRPTAELVRLLELREAQLRGRARSRRRRSRPRQNAHTPARGGHVDLRSRVFSGRAR